MLKRIKEWLHRSKRLLLRLLCAYRNENFNIQTKDRTPLKLLLFRAAAKMVIKAIEKLLNIINKVSFYKPHRRMKKKKPNHVEERVPIAENKKIVFLVSTITKVLRFVKEVGGQIYGFWKNIAN